MRIALDAMGGDAAPQATVEGAVDAARELGLGILLVGDRTRIEPELARLKTGDLDIEVRHATQTIGMDEAPTAALRKIDSSMHLGLQAIRDGEAAAFVFAGNTGAGMVLGAHLLGCAPGVERPAIAVMVPSVRGHTILLDAGANVDCRPIHLIQFAVMGDAYARAVRHVAAPRIGLLSNGLEDGKGNGAVRAAAPLLRQLPINFVGYVEGGAADSTDVVVCDGFVGNVVLKSLEGFGKLIGDRLRAALERNWRTKLAYLLLRRDVEALRHDLDARETGGALLLGLNGIAVKAHGSSDARAIRNAVAVAANLARSAVTEQVASGIAATVGLDATAEPPRGRRFWSSIRERLRREGRAATRSTEAGTGDRAPRPQAPTRIEGDQARPSTTPARSADRDEASPPSPGAEAAGVAPREPGAGTTDAPSKRDGAGTMGAASKRDGTAAPPPTPPPEKPR